MKEEKVEVGEIVFCDLTVYHKGKEIELTDVVYKETGDLFYKPYYLSKFKIDIPVKVKITNIKARLGFESKSKGFTEVKGSDEKRNKITGAYE